MKPGDRVYIKPLQCEGIIVPYIEESPSSYGDKYINKVFDVRVQFIGESKKGRRMKLSRLFSRNLLEPIKSLLEY
jgi:hypothetical protein